LDDMFQCVLPDLTAVYDPAAIIDNHWKRLFHLPWFRQKSRHFYAFTHIADLEQLHLFPECCICRNLSFIDDFAVSTLKGILRFALPGSRFPYLGMAQLIGIRLGIMIYKDISGESGQEHKKDETYP